MRPLLLTALLVLLLPFDFVRAESLPYERQRDVIYGHKDGMALTMDVFAPKENANGAAVVAIVSGGWFSSRANIDSPFFRYHVEVPVKRGYTVFAVCHGSQPRYIVPDAVADVNRAVRFIRHRARDYRIDPRRIGVTGGSAGGHLSLMLGVAGKDGDPQASDAVERTSSRVQAVGCFFPPTDFLNYGAKGKNPFDDGGVLVNYRVAVDVRELDKKTHRLERLTNKDKIEAFYRRISPITHVHADAAPTLIIHGDADKLVPLQQAEIMVERLKKDGVSAKLIVKKDGGHLWPGMEKDMVAIVDWFDRYLLKKP